MTKQQQQQDLHLLEVRFEHFERRLESLLEQFNKRLDFIERVAMQPLAPASAPLPSASSGQVFEDMLRNWLESQQRHPSSPSSLPPAATLTTQQQELQQQQQQQPTAVAVVSCTFQDPVESQTAQQDPVIAQPLKPLGRRRTLI
jgi:beta-xylosidase